MPPNLATENDMLWEDCAESFDVAMLQIVDTVEQDLPTSRQWLDSETCRKEDEAESNWHNGNNPASIRLTNRYPQLLIPITRPMFRRSAAWLPWASSVAAVLAVEMRPFESPKQNLQTRAQVKLVDNPNSNEKTMDSSKHAFKTMVLP